jgi:hypothetical protein
MFRKAKDFFREIKYALQRMKKGYCDQDLFSIDHWFLNIMPKMLEEFSKDLIGNPRGMNEQQWNDILKEMIYHFNEANEETCSYKNIYIDTFPMEFDFEQVPGKPYSILKEPEMTPEEKENKKKWSEENTKIYEYRKQHLKDGLELFCKHFRDLWD